MKCRSSSAGADQPLKAASSGLTGHQQVDRPPAVYGCAAELHPSHTLTHPSAKPSPVKALGQAAAAAAAAACVCSPLLSCR
jgi:hypothetical protein